MNATTSVFRSLAVLATALLLAVNVSADTAKAPESPDFYIDRFVVTNGGVIYSGNATMRISLTSGQTAVGTVSGPTLTMSYGFWNAWGAGGEVSCCDIRVGDANGQGGDEPTIGDVAIIIDAKFITVSCEGLLPCLEEADVNQSGGIEPVCDDVTIADIARLIDYLFITGSSLGLADCL